MVVDATGDCPCLPGFLQPVSSFSVPSFSNCVAKSNDLFSSSSFSMVRSPFETVPASGGRPASLTKASYDYGCRSLARLSVKQTGRGVDTDLVVVVRLQEASHDGGRRIFGRHICWKSARRRGLHHNNSPQQKDCLSGNHKRLDHMSVKMAGRLSPTRNEGDVIAKPAQRQH